MSAMAGATAMDCYLVSGRALSILLRPILNWRQWSSTRVLGALATLAIKAAWGCHLGSKSTCPVNARSGKRDVK